MAAQSPRAIYASNGLEIDLSRRELRRRGISVPIGSRAFEILELLVRSGGELVDKYHIMDSIWPGAIVEENTLQFHISALRKALGTDRSLLKTASGRGYRLLGQWTVREVTALQHRPDPPVEPRQPFRTNVPIAGSALIGRSMPRQQLLNVLSAYRVVTLTGPGGIGKSVLALAVARNLFPTLDGDCWLVELASLSDPTLVPSAVASVLGLRMGGNDISAASVARAIGSEKLLLVLDNCEHLADAAASLAEALVRLCPNVSILATSREILRIEGEYVYRVPSLDVPPRNPADVASIGAYSAVRLFAARLTTLDSGFSSRPEDLPLIAAICKRLDGIPLAIEFAAARAATLGLQQVADRLNDRFNLLTGGRRTALPRHLTLRATLDWSHELLTEPERLLLRRLAVFASTFSLEAVGAVVASVESASPEVVDSLSSLVAKSLVVAEINATTPRYRLLDTTRAYAFEKLAESGERERLARRHAEYYRDLFERAEAELEMRPTVDWLDDYGRHIDDIRAALDWSFSSAGDTSIGLAITVAAVPLWMQASLMEESRRRIEQALGSLASQTTWDKRREMQLLTAWGVSLLLTRGGAAEMNAAWTSALRIAEELDDTDYRLRALWGLYIDHLTRGDYRTALACAERFHQLTASAAESTDRFMGERMIGTALHMLGNQNDARRHFEQMLGLHLAPDYRPNVTRFPFDQRAQGRSFFSRVLWLQGFADQAMQLVARNVDLARANDHPTGLFTVLTLSACPVALLAGDLVAADGYVAMLLDLSDRRAVQSWNVWGQGFKGILMIRQGDVAAGLQLQRTALASLPDTGFHLQYTAFLGELAQSLGLAGETANGLSTIDEALARCARNEEGWYLAELLRLKAELLLMQGAAAMAEDHFKQALTCARRQQVLSWELRAATSFARLLRSQGRCSDGMALLQPVYDRFTEGFGTADVKEAKALLRDLGQSG